MKKILLVVLALSLFCGTGFAVVFPSFTVRDTSGNQLKMNSDGSINCSFSGSTTFNATTTFLYGLKTSTIVAQGTIVSTSTITGNNIVSTYNVSAGSATIPILTGKVTVQNTITASKGISASTGSITTAQISTIPNKLTVSDTITASKGISASTGSITTAQISTIPNKLTVSDTITASKGISASTITFNNGFVDVICPNTIRSYFVFVSTALKTGEEYSFTKANGKAGSFVLNGSTYTVNGSHSSSAVISLGVCSADVASSATGVGLYIRDGGTVPILGNKSAATITVRGFYWGEN